MTSLIAKLQRFFPSSGAPPAAGAEPGSDAERVALLADLRRRIERLERRPANGPPRLPPMPLVAGRRRAPLRLADLPDASVEDGVVVVRRRVAPDARVGRVAPADAVVAPPDVAAPLAGLQVPAPRELLHAMRLLDIETTGLAGGTGTLAFLVGVGAFEPDGTLVVEQFLLGAPAEEERLLDRLAARLVGASLLVTFNGRSFDAPLLRTRCILRRRASGPLSTAPHLDLLPIARRLWRGRASDCRLVTLEERVLGRRRDEDLPGSMAPAAYGEFLRTGDAAALAPVVAHNHDDLAGSAALLAAALRAFEDPMRWAEDAGELLAVGEHRLRLGDEASALPLLERAVELARAPDVRRRALTQLARVHRRGGRIADARRAWERALAEFPRENFAYVELANLLEHRVRDPQAAYRVAAATPHPAAHELEWRLERLRRKIAARPDER